MLKSRVVRIFNVNRTTFPQNRTIFTLNQYTDFKNVGHDFLPDQEYYIKYKVTHNRSGKHIEKVYPIPFTMKPLPPVALLNFDYRLTLNELDRVGITISNLEFSHPIWEDTSRLHVNYQFVYYNQRGTVVFQFSRSVFDVQAYIKDGEMLPIILPIFRLDPSSVYISTILRVWVHPSVSIQKSIETPRYSIPEIVTEETLLHEGSTRD